MVDRLSGPARRARAGIGGLANNVRQMGQRIRRAAGEFLRGERSLGSFARAARRAVTVGLTRMLRSAGQGARRLGRDLMGLVRRLRLVERAGAAAGRGLRKLGGAALGMMKTGLLAGGAAAVGAGGFALFDLFNTAGQFEQYQAMLEGTEGSVAAAQKSMAWVTKFAKETPYELDQVMEAFVALKAYGIDPMDGTLKALGDAASGVSKPLGSAVEAIADAMTGEYERLKEFSIRAEKAGNRTTFSYVKNGKTITRVAQGQGEAVREALVGIFNERFGGGMERQATTFFGIISNLKGAWSEFLLLVANAGIFDMVKRDLQRLYENVEKLAESGELKRWAEDISERLKEAWEWGKTFVMETDWQKVGSDLQTIASAVKTVADAIMELKRIKDSFGEWGALTVSPLGTVAAGGRALLGGGEPARAPVPERAPGRVPSDNEFLRSLLGKPKSVDIGGTLKIDVNSSPGAAVRATPAAAPGSKLAMQVNTGRTMRGFA
ncbi:tape measure protein [Porphyrobacter sp. YT40]|uniref:tape measure protein n=1 Tax=Porphyrobacter sp. YT40 TaxID=2547601 RepID=UPI0011423390|nr:tape measure protein [Porphyrobacter sp. YT40]QDH35855.1 hypothetical protein E2E27_16940 [Porphyrobacter sp. YT40]